MTLATVPTFFEDQARCTGLVFLRHQPLHLPCSGTGALSQKHTLHYSRALDTLASFQNLSVHSTENLIFVWITNPNNHTKINPAHFAARGFSLAHTLFLESTAIHRTVSSLIARAPIRAIILDGYPTDRVLLQLARRWLKTSTSVTGKHHGLICADDLQNTSHRLFLMGR